jgi:acyl-coenzyme A synthetase/AMP-(fatty) acid ligase
MSLPAMRSLGDDALAWGALALPGRAGPGRSRRHLVAAVERVGKALAQRDWRRPVLSCADRFHALVGLLACWTEGRTPVLPPNLRPETRRALFHEGNADGLLQDDRSGEGLDLALLCGLADRGDAPAPAERLARLEAVLASRSDVNVLYIYTSGSTGESVSVPKTSGQLLGEVATLCETFALDDGTRVLATAPPHHIYGLLFGVLTPLMSGGAFVRDNPLDPGELTRIARDCAVNILCAVPAHLSTFEALPPEALEGVERVFSSGAPLPRRTAEALRRGFGLRVTEVLGSSETGGIAWRDVGAGEHRDAAAPIEWQPFPRVRVSAADDGVLLIDSPFVHPGLPRPWRGADRIEMTSGGRFRHLGRADAILKVGGTRVSLAEIEVRLRALEGVEDAAVIALPQDGPRGHEICAAIVAPGLTAADLRSGLLRWFDPIALPRRLRLVAALPREQNGKLQRASLVSLFGAAVEEQAATAAAVEVP